MKPEIKKEYYNNGNILSIKYLLYNKYYREGETSIKYILNNKYHREDGPAIIYYNQDGSLNCEEYYLNGKQHREDGPAFISYYSNGNVYILEYYLNGKQHREDGPASIQYEYDKISCEGYYINNKRLTKSEWLIHCRKRKLKSL